MKRRREVIEEISSLDFSRLDDSDLLASIGELRVELGSRRLPESILPRLFTIIREIADRRPEVWKLFDEATSPLSPSIPFYQRLI